MVVDVVVVVVGCGWLRVLVQAFLALGTMSGQGETEYLHGAMMETQNARINDNGRQFFSWQSN